VDQFSPTAQATQNGKPSALVANSSPAGHDPTANRHELQGEKAGERHQPSNHVLSAGGFPSTVPHTIADLFTEVGEAAVGIQRPTSTYLTTRESRNFMEKAVKACVIVAYLNPVGVEGSTCMLNNPELARTYDEFPIVTTPGSSQSFRLKMDTNKSRKPNIPQSHPPVMPE
jgi:hypothetical protein